MTNFINSYPERKTECFAGKKLRDSLKTGFKFDPIPFVDAVKSCGYTQLMLLNSRPYTITDNGYETHFYEKIVDNKRIDLIGVRYSNDEQSQLSIYSYNQLNTWIFIPIMEVIKIKSYGLSNKLLYLSTIKNMSNLLSYAMEKRHKLVNFLFNAKLSDVKINLLCNDSVKLRNKKFNNGVMQFICNKFEQDKTKGIVNSVYYYGLNGYDLVNYLCIDLFQSLTHNNQYHRILENQRAIILVTDFVVKTILTMANEE